MKIVILPGLDGTGLLLETFAKSLSARHIVEVLSYPTDKSSYEDLLIWLRKRLPPEEHVIVAESFSGPLAIELATSKPSALKGIVFAASFARSPKMIAPWMISFLKYFPRCPKLLAKLSKPFVFGRVGTSQFDNQYTAALQQVSLRILINRLQEVLDTDLRSQLPCVALSCLYLQASNDLLFPSYVSADFRLCSAEFQTVKGPHFLLQKEPELCASLVSEFVKGLD